MLSFLRNLAGVKTDQAAQGALEALVRWDPKAATEAELRTMEQHLDDLGLQVAQARATYDRERGEADAIQRLSQQRMAAAEQLERQLAGEADPTRKATLERSLATLVEMLFHGPEFGLRGRFRVPAHECFERAPGGLVGLDPGEVADERHDHGEPFWLVVERSD